MSSHPARMVGESCAAAERSMPSPSVPGLPPERATGGWRGLGPSSLQPLPALGSGSRAGRGGYEVVTGWARPPPHGSAPCPAPRCGAMPAWRVHTHAPPVRTRLCAHTSRASASAHAHGRTLTCECPLPECLQPLCARTALRVHPPQLLTHVLARACSCPHIATNVPCPCMLAHPHAGTREHAHEERQEEPLLGRGSIVVVLDELVLAEEAVEAQGPRPTCHRLGILLRGWAWMTLAAPRPPCSAPGGLGRAPVGPSPSSHPLHRAGC